MVTPNANFLKICGSVSIASRAAGSDQHIVGISDVKRVLILPGLDIRGFFKFFRR